MLNNITKIIAIASGKGGVGKSTVTANLAYTLKERGKKVGILDADIYGHNIPKLLGLSGDVQIAEDKKMIPHEIDGIKVASMGFVVQEGKPIIWRGPLVHKAILELYNGVVWGDLDVLLLDLPPGTGDAQLTIITSIPLTGALIVSTPHRLSQFDAEKAFRMFEESKQRVFGIVENMSDPVCPHCGKSISLLGSGATEGLCRKLSTPFLGSIPFAPAIANEIWKTVPENTKEQFRKITEAI
ncbi:MAG TPA: Mrp/NBP35 family ATP-binding protein [Patescibacteria group bacterium]|nr:Mrp/NBP35 family ATP-binding protein [Patescibacteria group bacterium]